MADVSYFNLSEQEVEVEVEEDDDRVQQHILDLDSLPYWSHDFDIYVSDPEHPLSDHPLLNVDVFDHCDPSVAIRGLDDVDVFDHCDPSVAIRGLDDVSEPDSITSVDLFDRENQVNFVMDLFQERVEQSRVMGERVLVSEPLTDSDFGVIEGNGDMNSNYLEVDLGLGFGIDRDENCGFMVDEPGDEFFVGRRRRRMFFGSESDGESSTICGHEAFVNGVQVIGLGSDSDDDDENEIFGVGLRLEDDYGLDHTHDDDTSVNLCWDSLQLEDPREANEDFEWEEVDGRIDERDVLSMMLDADEEEGPVSVSVSPVNQSEGEVNVGGLANLEWEVLLTVDSLERNRELGNDAEPYFGDHDDYIHTAEYEMLFGQFAENENASIGQPPASKSIVENLPIVVLTQEDVVDNNALCAVCKDEMNVGENAKQLPCLHRYHGDCILPWLGIRNTCPVCRHELPTDDAVYERRRTQRAGRGGL